VFLVIAGTLAVLFFVLFVALGTWQVKRRVWKLDLIARVEQRVHAPPAAAPGPAEWPNVTAAADEYRHVAETGMFLDDSQTLVQAVTDLGAGYWVLTPLRLVDGSIVLVNRGFVQADDRNRVQPGTTAKATATMIPPGTTAQPTATMTPPAATGERATAGQQATPSQRATTREPTSTVPPVAAARVIGLLRMTEPRGGFVRHNDAAANLWYSRDVQAIAAARGLTRVAPYFIDAEAAADQPAASASSAAARASGDAVVGRAASDGSGALASAASDQPTASASPAADQARPSASSAAAAEPGNSAARAAANGRAVAPVAGLTVITFHNSHLVYAITWYTLALMVAGAIWLGVRNETRT
jgi:surfeit locus 1 family protein